jgi:transcription factor C subunit 6
MVLLRERRARPSYSNIPEGLEDLSGSDEVVGADGGEGGEASGSGSASCSESDGDAGSDNAQQQGSLSSGNSSEFNPEEDEEERPKRGRPKGSRDARPPSRSFDDDGDMDEGVSEEESEPGEEPEGDVVPLEPAASKNVKGRISVLPRQQASAPIYLQSEVNLIPPAYRQLIKESAGTLAKLPISRPSPVASDHKYRSLRSEVFPAGASTPWITRLTKEPRGRKTALKVENDGGDKGKRRQQEFIVNRRITLETPWQAWQGEGWWPEMHDTTGQSAPGQSTLRGWRMREEVRIGLDQVARAKMEELEIISEV